MFGVGEKDSLQYSGFAVFMWTGSVLTEMSAEASLFRLPTIEVRDTPA